MSKLTPKEKREANHFAMIARKAFDAIAHNPFVVAGRPEVATSLWLAAQGRWGEASITAGMADDASGIWSDFAAEVMKISDTPSQV